MAITQTQYAPRILRTQSLHIWIFIGEAFHGSTEKLIHFSWSMDVSSWYSIIIWHLTLVTYNFKLIISFYSIFEKKKKIHLVPRLGQNEIWAKYIIDVVFFQKKEIIIWLLNSPISEHFKASCFSGKPSHANRTIRFEQYVWRQKIEISQLIYLIITINLW